MTCSARIRPMRPANDTEVACTLDGEHGEHSGTIRDYAYPGSSTEIRWLDGDRRMFVAEWPGACPTSGCILPLAHRGECAL